MSLVQKTLRMVQEKTPYMRTASASRADAETATPTKDSDGRRLTPGVAGELAGRRLQVNLAALSASGLLATEDDEPQMAQQYRRIKRPLIINATARGAARVPNAHLIMVASALAGEGKTFTVINLALSMSREKDLHVLLIDADVAKAHLSRLLGAGEAPGLLDVLRDERQGLENVILSTDVPNLSLLAAGKHSQGTTELLASARMEEVMRAIARDDQRRVALIDSPPFLLTTESHAIAQVAGQVLIVVRAGATSQQSVLAALSYVGGHATVSLVLNQTTASGPADYYYGYPGRTAK